MTIFSLLGLRNVSLGVCALAISAAAGASEYAVGNRSFPPQPTTDDPFVADALYVGLTGLTQPANADTPQTRETEIAAGVEVRLTDRLGLEVESSYTILDPRRGASVYGFQNIAAVVKYQLVMDEPHEFLLSIGLEQSFGGTGAARAGAESGGTTTPVLYVGKGFGDLPEGLKYLRPLAMTASVQTGFSGDRTANTVSVGYALEYSFRYLEGNVAYIGLPPILERTTPIVEFSYAAPLGRSFGTAPSGVIAPGIVYAGGFFDLGIEAQLPVTRASGTGVGVAALLHLQLDRLLPQFFGNPPFG